MCRSYSQQDTLGVITRSGSTDKVITYSHLYKKPELKGRSMSKEREVDTSVDRTPLSGPESPKRPYQKPMFRHEGVFETMALACGKINSTQSQCQHILKTS